MWQQMFKDFDISVNSFTHVNSPQTPLNRFLPDSLGGSGTWSCRLKSFSGIRSSFNISNRFLCSERFELLDKEIRSAGLSQHLRIMRSTRLQDLHLTVSWIWDSSVQFNTNVWKTDLIVTRFMSLFGDAESQLQDLISSAVRYTWWDFYLVTMRHINHYYEKMFSVVNKCAFVQMISLIHSVLPPHSLRDEPGVLKLSWGLCLVSKPFCDLGL